MHFPSISVFGLFWLVFASLQHNQLTSRHSRSRAWQATAAAAAVGGRQPSPPDGSNAAEPFDFQWQAALPPPALTLARTAGAPSPSWRTRNAFEDDERAGAAGGEGARRQSAAINPRRMSRSEWSEQQQLRQQPHGPQVVGELAEEAKAEKTLPQGAGRPAALLNKTRAAALPRQGDGEAGVDEEETRAVNVTALDNTTAAATSTRTSTTTTTTTTTTRTLSTKKRMLKPAKESLARGRGVDGGDEKFGSSFLQQFKESVTKLLTDAEEDDGGGGEHWQQQQHNTDEEPPAAPSPPDHPVELNVTHTPERRHIVPEKLQYTRKLTLKQGQVMGIVRHFQPATGLLDVDQFLGLPYAEAPVGSRRFMPPGAASPWNGVKVASHLPPVCPQRLPDAATAGSAQRTSAAQQLSRGRFKYLMRLLPYLKTESEDCLHLNVYVPHQGPSDRLLQPYPVVVYVHGESFEWNSGNPYDGSVLASYGQVIVVTINYRLGVLGFLKPGLSEHTIANFGLLDQIAALHWIKENIASFGGNPDSVTLMGHGTGAACVNYLMVSPVASGLFHRAILMSGSAMSDWAASNHSLQLTMQMAHALDCPLLDADEDEQLLACLRDKRYKEILGALPASLPQFATPLGPIVDGHVIPDQPYKAMGYFTEQFSRYDLLFGVTESESYHALGAAALELGLRESERDNLLRSYMQSRFDVRPDLASAATLKKYNDMYNNPIKATNLEHRDVVLDILSDARVVGPLIQTGLFHADVNRHNYMYVFGHNSAAGPHASVPYSISGEELAFVFGAPLAPAGPFASSNYSAQEKLLSEAVMAYWTNFAKTGNPKAPWRGSFINLHGLEWDRYDMDWPEFGKRTQAYCNIGIPPSIGYKYRQLYMHFWNKELPDDLNQIAALQQQPFLPVPQSGADNDNDDDEGRESAAAGGGVITGQMAKFGSSDDTAQDPVRKLKLLLNEPYGGGGGGRATHLLDATAAENMYNAPPTFGVARRLPGDEEFAVMNTSPTNAFAAGGGRGIIYGVTRTGEGQQPAAVGGEVGGGGLGASPAAVDGNLDDAGGVATTDDRGADIVKSEATLQLLIGLILVFIVLNVLIYSTFLLHRKSRKKSALGKRAHLGGILSYDGATDDELKRCKHTAVQSDGDESYVLDVVRKSNTYEAVKMDRSPINGFRITRQLSASTVDTHTKVSEWICATGDGRRGGAGGAGAGGFDTHTRLPSSPKVSQKSSSATFSSLHGGSSGVGGGAGCDGAGSGSGGGSGSFTPQKVSVAVDATPQARSNSVLAQEPIELTKLKGADGRNIIICQDIEVADQEMLTPQNSLDGGGGGRYSLLGRQFSTATTAACEAELPPQGERHLLVVDHQHSRSDPVEMFYRPGEQVTSFMDSPAAHWTVDGGGPGGDINVTSRDELDESLLQALTAEQQLLMMKQRNYPKVLPTAAALRRPTTAGTAAVGEREADSPPMTLDLTTTNKRYSLPPNGLAAPWNIATYGGKYVPPPVPPPRVSTLGRRHSPGERRGSNSFTTSPVSLAHDCTEEDEEPQITQNTLIVGPIVPKGPTNCATPKRGRRELGQPGAVDDAVNDAAASPQHKCSPNFVGHNNSNNKNCNTAGIAVVGREGGGGVGDMTRIPPPSHHTEKVYTIGAPPAPMSLNAYLTAASPFGAPFHPLAGAAAANAEGQVADSATAAKIAIKPNLAAATAAALNRLLSPSLIPRFASATAAAAAAAAGLPPPPAEASSASAALRAAAGLTAPHNCNPSSSSAATSLSCAPTVAEAMGTAAQPLLRGAGESVPPGVTTTAISRIPQLSRTTQAAEGEQPAKAPANSPPAAAAAQSPPPPAINNAVGAALSNKSTRAANAAATVAAAAVTTNAAQPSVSGAHTLNGSTTQAPSISAKTPGTPAAGLQPHHQQQVSPRTPATATATTTSATTTRTNPSPPPLSAQSGRSSTASACSASSTSSSVTAQCDDSASSSSGTSSSSSSAGTVRTAFQQK